MSRDTASSGATFGTGEFVEIEYTARIAGDGTVVDTTDSSVAAESGLEGVGTGGSVVVVLGEGHVFGPVEDAIMEMRPGERRTVTVNPADAFGETDPMRRHSLPV
ncbi:MAG: FKBP-type peptidyl-prolyl cis-trans isomerase, partial [Halovenus sp.]